ncbi:MAG: hypothetical protein EA411_03245 [Saprospirales bacterium]|nr:MAG: hypothetical protein EA411_03245 [Saprospirales bacterium]
MCSERAEGKTLFSESQNFLMAFPLLVIAMLFLNLLFLYGIVQQEIFERPFGDQPMSTTGLFLLFGFTFIITAFLYSLRLEMHLEKDRIRVRFFPVHRSFYEFTVQQVEQCSVRKYKPMREFGGWGLRKNLRTSAKAWTVSGNSGLELVFSKGNKLLIGTKKPISLKKAMEQSNFPLQKESENEQ